MLITNAAALVRAGRKDAPLRKALALWMDKAQAGDWTNFRDLRRTFPSGDGVVIKRKGGTTITATVFNIKGNSFRLVAIVDYPGGQVIVREILTHAEYDRDDWKGRI
jgi:mRNA interferase HigB